MNGGRDKWIAEGRALTRREAVVPGLALPRAGRRLDDEIRAFADDALAQSKAGKPLIDVRSPGEYKGTVTHMPEYPQEGVLRGGHIPGAKSVPWKTAVNEDGTFRSAGGAGEDLHRELRAAERSRRSSRIAGSGSGRAIPGSCSPTCWAIRACAITTARGRSGEIACGCRSSAPPDGARELKFELRVNLSSAAASFP